MRMRARMHARTHAHTHTRTHARTHAQTHRQTDRQTECPLNGECTTSNVLYEAKINSNQRNYAEKLYKGITVTIFKTRYGNHKNSLNNIKYYNEDELSKEVWKIKNKGGKFNIKWQIIKQYPTYHPSNKKCALCLSEDLNP